MSAAPLRGAIIGHGHVAHAGHMPFWRDCRHADIVAAVDSDPARLALFEGEGGRGFPTLAGLLAAERLDFVDICTSPASHAGLIEAALAAGLHVLCEKPLCIDAADTARVAADARARGLVLHTVHNWLNAPVCRELSRLLANGAVGAVRHVEWQTLRSAPAAAVGGDGSRNWRLDPKVAGGGILFDHGWHAIYCVAAWAGAAPARVRATLENRRFRDLGVEDTATLDIGFDNGATGHIHLTWAADIRANLVSVVGTSGRIDVDGAGVNIDRDGEATAFDCPPSLAEGSQHPDWFARLATEFLEAVAGSAPSNVDMALVCSRVIAAAQASAINGGEVVLSGSGTSEQGQAGGAGELR